MPRRHPFLLERVTGIRTPPSKLGNKPHLENPIGKTTCGLKRFLAPIIHSNRKGTSYDAPFLLERVTGIEPAWPAWEAGVLPLDYTRECIYYIPFPFICQGGISKKTVFCPTEFDFVLPIRRDRMAGTEGNRRFVCSPWG